ncbi:MAG: hypothetical protein ACJA1L_000961 [Paracoccaceae bacterium]|jgi:hypothetical protein
MTPFAASRRPARRQGCRALALIGMAALAPAAAHAQDAAAYAEVDPGAAYTYEFGSGGNIIMRLEEKSDTGAVWSIIPGGDPGGEIAAKMIHDSEGRLTAYETADGDPVEVYVPHNCERVELLCRYQMTDAEGVHTEQRFSELKDGEWSYSVLRLDNGGFDARRLGSVRYDADGVVQTETWADLSTAVEESVTRVK